MALPDEPVGAGIAHDLHVRSEAVYSSGDGIQYPCLWPELIFQPVTRGKLVPDSFQRPARLSRTIPIASKIAATIRRKMRSGMRRSSLTPARVPTITPAVAEKITVDASLMRCQPVAMYTGKRTASTHRAMAVAVATNAS